MFSIKRKSGSIRNSERADDLPLTKTFLDVPLCTSVCLVDDIEQLIITCSTQTFYPFTYSVEQYPESHHS